MKASEAAKLLNVHVQTIHLAKKRGTLKYTKNSKDMYDFSFEDLLEYKKNKYSRRSLNNLSENEITIAEAVKKYKIRINSIYYALRRKRLFPNKTNPITFLEEDFVKWYKTIKTKKGKIKKC